MEIRRRSKTLRCLEQIDVTDEDCKWIVTLENPLCAV